MQVKIRIKKTNEIVYADEQVEITGNKTVVKNSKEYSIPLREFHFYKSPDSTEEYDKDEIEIIPQTPFELFGVECGDGWKDAIQPLFDYIKEYNQKEEHKDSSIEIEQVKEKFGELRFYTNFVTDELRDLMHKAEEECLKTCELCGSREDVGQTCGWITTCCRKCVQNLANEHSNAVYRWFDRTAKKVVEIKCVDKRDKGE